MEEEQRAKEIPGKGEREMETVGRKLPLHLQRGGCAEILLKKPTHSDQRKFFLGSLLFGSIGRGS